MRATIADRLYGTAAAVTFTTLRWCSRALARPVDEARTGRLPRPTSPLVWLHGASAGEMAAAVNLTRILRSAGLEFTPGYTAANRAGLAFVSKHASQESVTSLAPWDAPKW